MMKKNKLYTINKRRAEIINRPAFMPDENLYSIGSWLKGAGNKLSGVMGGGQLADSPMGGLIGGLGTAVGGLANNLISGDYKSGAGSAITGIGSTVGSAISNVNPVLGGIVSVGSGIIGGAVNALFGQSVDEEALKQANEGTAAYNNFTSNAGTFDEIKGPEAQANVRDVYKDGLFGGDADEKNEALKEARRDARQWAGRSVDNNIFNLQQDQVNNAMRNFKAFGGLTRPKKHKFDTGGFTYNPFELYGGYGSLDDFHQAQADNTVHSGVYAAFGGSLTRPKKRKFDDGGYMTEQEAEKAAADSFHNNVIWNSNLPFGLKGYSILGKEGFNAMYGNLLNGNSPALYSLGGFRTSGLIGDLNTSENLPSLEEQNQMYGQGLLMPGESNVMGGKGPDTFTWANGGRLFDIGGVLQTHGGDFSDGLITVNAGGTHEESPYDGVQMGVDPEGTPNLVEEGETIWNDYVFSNRILADETTKQMFHLPKKRDITFADISKKFEKEIAERPNDPISKAGFKSQMQTLEEQQERQKQEMEAERAKAAFEALSPEEQTAVMQNVAQKEAMAQQAAQEQAIAEQQAMQQATPEELAMAQQAQQQADGSQAALGQEAPMMAEGGKLFKEGGKKNAGTWKKGSSKENWDKYTRNGLKDFLQKVNDDIASADTEEEKNKIREDAIKTVRGIQQAYSEAYQQNLTPSEVNEKVTALQKAFQNAGGNAYFADIADNINLPKGHNTEDTEEKGWIDGLWGPRTSIRNWGSTEYGNDYDDIRELAQEAGLTYAPGQYKYGDNTLYELGMAQPDVAAVEPEAEAAWDYGDPSIKAEESKATVPSSEKTEDDEDGIVPLHRKEWMRYAGLFGPAVGLGMQMAGVGRPDTASLDAAISGAGNVYTADYQPIGNYLTYRPLDIWYEQNRANALSRATDRNIMNTSGGNRGTAMAGLIANGYNSQLASGNLFRQAEESNLAQRERVEEFNRGTNQFNAEAYNRNSQFNASERNRANQYAKQLALHAASQKMNADAGWYNGIYGNVAGLFKGLSDLGRENAQWNMISKTAADGVFGNLGDSYTGSMYVTKDKKKAAKGGKLKKGKRGLTY